MNQKTIIRRSKGFTLIELLVVVAIIGILSTLLMANFIGIRQRARDATRKSDLRQIQSALELYRSDAGTYPTTDYPSSCGSPLLGGSSTYMSKIPCDPMGNSYYNLGSYYYSSNGTTYILGACLENTSDSQGTDTSPGGSGCTTNFYYVTNNP